ncbi:hypothetical protein FZW96_21180 [Bacillus sp. BGMRC 2118]|nr:hypothetical protein FZW96_21180 [Bacillus sp. BGMRC 2118]
MNNNVFFKKILVSIISIVISILLLPLLMGGFHTNFLQEYVHTLLLYSIYGIPFMVFLGAPVNILSGFILERNFQFKLFINFLIHVVPALVVGIFMFSGGPFLIICLFVSSIFFVVDTIVFKKNQDSNKLYFVILLPFFVWLFIYIPNYINKLEFSQIQNREPAIVELNVNGEIQEVRASACWDSEGSSGCPIDDEPILLPIDAAMSNEFKLTDETEVSVNIHNREKYTKMQVFYLDEHVTKKVTTEGNKFILPDNLQDQVVKVSVTMDDSEIISFNFGIRYSNHN